MRTIDIHVIKTLICKFKKKTLKHVFFTFIKKNIKSMHKFANYSIHSSKKHHRKCSLCQIAHEKCIIFVGLIFGTFLF